MVWTSGLKSRQGWSLDDDIDLPVGGLQGRSFRRRFYSLRRQAWTPAGHTLFGLLLMTGLALAFSFKHPGIKVFEMQQIAPQRGRVVVWDPDESFACTGNFATGQAEHSADAFPLAVVRDVVVEHRSVSHRDFKQSHPGVDVYERIVIHVTAHLSTTVVEWEDDVARIDVNGNHAAGEEEDGGDSFPSISGRVEYVLPINPYCRRPGEYSPGTTTVQGHEVLEYQVVVSLIPDSGMSQEDFRSHLLVRSKRGDQLALTIGLQTFGVSDVSSFDISFSLGCALGWEEATVADPDLDLFLSPRPQCNANTVGSVALGGGALHGFKAQDPERMAEVAHFAARSLRGPFPFDYAAVSVIPLVSAREVTDLCGTNTDCQERERKRNAQHLNNVARVVDEELQRLGFPPSLHKRVILLPLCRLGAHYHGNEKGAPCLSSVWSGQHVVNSFMYNLIGSSFRWAASWDIDEYLAPTKPIDKPMSASDFFDSVNTKGTNGMVFKWLNFLVNDTRLWPALTADVMSSRIPELRTSSGEPAPECFGYQEEGSEADKGKSALKCDNGMAFNVHHAIQAHREGNLTHVYSTLVDAVSDVRVWHPRSHASFGQCTYNG